jgi:hypothetical protein
MYYRNNKKIRDEYKLIGDNMEIYRDSLYDLRCKSALPFLKHAFADHGKEITITLHNSSFGSLTSGGGNQVGVFANYQLNDNSIAGQTINAVMEVYAPNGSLIRTSSYPNGFVAQSAGGVEGLETTIRDPTIQSITANVTFRNLDKTTILSNDLRVNLNLAEAGGTTPMAATGDGGVGLEEETLGSDSELEEGPSQPTDQGESGPSDDDVGGSDEDIEDEKQGEELKKLGAAELVIADLEKEFDHAFRGIDAVIFAAGSGGHTSPCEGSGQPVLKRDRVRRSATRARARRRGRPRGRAPSATS